jgi:hypothetical protein
MFKFTPTAALLAVLSCATFTANAGSLQSIDAAWASRLAPISAVTAQRVPLKDGFTLHEYQDGKMAVENRFGRPVVVPPGHMLTTADGRSIRMVGDEVARLTAEMRSSDHR